MRHHIARPAEGLPRPLAWVMAVAAGVIVANIYYNQPLLAIMGQTFSASPKQSGLIATLTQAGYGLGLLFLVPLADIVERRRIILLLTMAAGLALIGAAVSPSLWLVLTASLAIGICSVVPQLLVPVAAYLSRPGEGGRAVGFVMSGLLIGILGARTVSGEIGERLGWRVMFATAAGLMVLMVLVLWHTIPVLKPSQPTSWTALMMSLADLARTEPVLREASLTGALYFACFSAFWATLIFRLGSPPYHLGPRAAGLFGLVGIVGAMAAPIAGKLADRSDPRVNLRWATVLIMLSFGVMWAFGDELWGLAVGVILLDAGVQSAQITNQTRVYAISREKQNRLNTVYMVCYFIGGGLGSAAGTYAWSRWQWSGVCGVSIVLSIVAFAALLRPSSVVAKAREPESVASA